MTDVLFPFSSQTDPSTAAFLTLLSPFPADNVKEIVNFNLPMNQQLVTIPFVTQKASAAIATTGPVIYNLVDANPFTGVTFTPTVFSNGSITGIVGANLDTANYFVTFVAFVKGT